MSGWPSACLGRDETEKIKQTSTAGWTYRFWHCGFLFFRRQVGQRDLRLFQIFKNKKPETGQRDSAVTVHEAVVSHFHEACWQDMLEEASDEFQGFKSDLAGAITSFLAIGEGDVSIFDSHDSGIGDGYPEDIGGEVFNAGITDAHRSRAPAGDVLSVDEIIEQFVFRDTIRCFIVMLDQLTHGAEIGFSGPFSHAVDLHGFIHF